MDKKAEIIQIMHENGSHDHNYGHLDIEHDDVDFIAEEIIKLFAIPDVVASVKITKCKSFKIHNPYEMYSKRMVNMFQKVDIVIIHLILH